MAVEPIPDYIVTRDIQGCASCGADHERVTFRLCGESQSGFLYVSECPVSGMTLYMMFEGGGEDE